jgi:hypothetical protein
MKRSCRQIGIKEDEQLSFPPRIKCGINSSGNPDVVPRIKYGASSAILVPVKTGSRGLFKGNGFRIRCGMTSLDKGIDSCLRRNDNEGKVFSDE